LRLALLTGFAGTVLLTRWPEWFAFGKVTPALQIVGDLIVFSPFPAGAVAIWLGAFPVEQALRGWSVYRPVGPDAAQQPAWRLRSYLDFNMRHHILVVAAPMTLILFAADLIRAYEAVLESWSGWFWTPDALLAAVALGVFIVSPIMLSRIWRTIPLKPGPIRERLEAICARIGLRCRGILIWDSDRMMINAAVMGLFAPVRFVLLSDALLATMSARQIEAVFGHEAGHVRNHHIQHFLVFAYIGWLLVVGIMELLARMAAGPEPIFAISSFTIQGIGVVAAALFWGIGFGWLSRRFERQADLFGARCAMPAATECLLPCSVHLDGKNTNDRDGRICATGAAVFSSALDRVALLNGIPHQERSWRHSSIASRIRFLASVAGDPRRAARFERLIRRIKITMLVAAIIGSVACILYCVLVPEPAILRLEAGKA
jgi:STE24 endopeptidase